MVNGKTWISYPYPTLSHLQNEHSIRIRPVHNFKFPLPRIPDLPFTPTVQPNASFAFGRGRGATIRMRDALLRFCQKHHEAKCRLDMGVVIIGRRSLA